MSTELRRLMTACALDMGAVLNTVEDDDERDLLRNHFEEVLNDELFAGSQNRRVVRPLYAALEHIGFGPIDIHSVRVSEQGFAALVDGPVDIFSKGRAH